MCGDRGYGVTIVEDFFLMAEPDLENSVFSIIDTGDFSKPEEKRTKEVRIVNKISPLRLSPSGKEEANGI